MSIRKRDQMTDTDWDELDATVQSKLPGHRVVRRSSRAGSAADAATHRLPVDVVTPELEALRAKYVRRPEAEGAADAPQATEESPPEVDDEDAIVAIEREGADPSDLTARPKSVVVNRRGDVLGAQG